ncbi:MAG TPA: sulfurtransferase TusA family protein [Tissierellaceae bacterium]
MAKVIDARGRSCPEPVMMTKNAIDNNETDLEVLVDTKVAVENITRFVKNKGFNISVEENNGEYKLIINR